ncbi:PadR family transcriptional regulator [Streptomyces sp. WAC06614]|uniref:PadR family transcriptional regulator n=1 Tax=Streptomyces sp. WAC06614 TaxID=2487416 RepID=UPI000F76F7E7|nr:PadR family transcriptional regulator [Streptomyces sp. WAC06614]RSS79752.1 PadR family transcriptional regulator [Streptomyces sp. WAC06614]
MTERMQEPTLLVLTALADSPRHGYAIMQEVQELSGGRVNLRTGTLYGALDRLVRQGLITTCAQEIVHGRARRTYALTPEGRDALAAEARRLRVTLHAVTDRLATPASHATVGTFA